MSQAPLYLGETIPSSFSHSPSASATTVRAESEPAQQPKHQGLAHQQRLLLQRGSGFRGITLPTGGINCHTPIGSPKAVRQIDGEEDEETTPRGVGRTTRCVVEATGNPLGILDEINNSAVKRRELSWASISRNQDQNLASSADYGGNTSSSCCKDSSKAVKMRSRGDSLTPQTPSPIAKHTKRRQRRSPNFRSTYLESAQYIEHLESQLVALQTQLQSLTSPTATKAHSAKLRALTTESRLLRQELSEWETRFNERVRDEVGGRVELEASLRARIKTLELELDIKDGKVRELQWELETLEGKARDIGTIETENVSLGRRVDMLTELLAQSPTKPTIEPAASLSTARRQKKSRPSSMFPRIVSSETAHAVPPPVQAQIDSKRDSVLSTTSTFCQSHWSDGYEDLLHHYPSKRNRVSTDLESVFSALSAASSVASTRPSFSRPTSAISDTSTNTGAWGLPAPSPISRDTQTRSNRHRKMRRFPSGSSAPKSLILPTTSNTAPLPASATLDGLSDFMYERPMARESMSARLPSAIGLPFGTSRYSYMGAPAWAEKETLKLLEANSASNRSYADLAKLNESPSPSPQPLRYQGSEASFGQGTPAQRESLFTEISRAEEGRLGSTPVTDTPQTTSRYMGLCASPNDRVYTPASVKSQSVVARGPALPVDVAGLGGFLWKLSVVLSEAWQNPVKLARKVISTGWSVRESKTAGELDWWLLGLLLRPARRKGKEQKLPDLGNSALGGFDWRDFSAEASKARSLSYFIGKDNVCEAVGSDGRTSAPLTVRAASPTSLKTIGCSNNQAGEPSQRKLFLWIEFTVALVLAVGVAVKDGPASVLPSCATADVGVMTDHQLGTAEPLRGGGLGDASGDGSTHFLESEL